MSYEIVWNDADRVGVWACERMGSDWNIRQQAIGLQKGGEIVAGVVYEGWNGSSIRMHVAGSPGYWPRRFIWMCFDYPFNQLQCKVIIGLVTEDNEKARRFDEALGFTLKHRIEDGAPSGALLVYELRKEDCRWLKYGKT